MEIYRRINGRCFKPLVKSAKQKNNYLISQPKRYVVGTQKNRLHLNETVLHMLKIMGKKILTILR